MKKRSRRWLLIFPVMGVLLVAGLGIRRARSAYTEVGIVKKGRVVEAVYGLGTVTARHTYQVKLGLTGQVKKVFVREGDAVKKGDKLVAVEGAASFYAPFDATVTSVPVKEGETVYPQLVLVALTDLNHNYIVVSLDQRSAMKVRPGMPVMLSFEGNRDQTRTAKVASIYPNDGQFLVRIDSDAIPKSALPGMTVDVAIQVGAKDDVLVAPVAAVQKGFLIIGKDRRRVAVTTGLVDGAGVEILTGEVRENEPVFVRAK